MKLGLSGAGWPRPSAAGVGNKVRFLLGHRKFPSTLQLFAHASKGGKIEDGIKRNSRREGVAFQKKKQNV